MILSMPIAQESRTAAQLSDPNEFRSKAASRQNSAATQTAASILCSFPHYFGSVLTATGKQELKAIPSPGSPRLSPNCPMIEVRDSLRFPLASSIIFRTQRESVIPRLAQSSGSFHRGEVATLQPIT